MNKQEKEISAEGAAKKLQWLELRGFSPEGIGYHINGETYSIKDILKEDGFKYHPILGWIRSYSDGYEDKVSKVNINDVAEFDIFGEVHFYPNAKEILDAADQSKTVLHLEPADFYGMIGDKIKNLMVTFIDRKSFMGKWGLTNIYSFIDLDGHLFVWFTSKTIYKEINDVFPIQGTIKGFDTFNGNKQTIITRVSIMG